MITVIKITKIIMMIRMKIVIMVNHIYTGKLGKLNEFA